MRVYQANCSICFEEKPLIAIEGFPDRREELGVTPVHRASSKSRNQQKGVGETNKFLS
jgi:hypothetical protein